ncbi:hypothetical protein WJX82_008359 [Trebouxia sp. C0006]
MPNVVAADRLHFRQANASDVDVLVQFNQAMAKETENIGLPVATLKAGVLSVIQDRSKGTYHIGELQGVIVAALMITYEWSDWRNRQLWWIQSVYVHPQHRRKGYFRQLYMHVKQLAQSQEAGGLRLYADNTNARAHTTYEALGMTSHYKVFEDMF